MSTSDLYSRSIRPKGGELWIDGVPASRIARGAGTPVYVYSAAAVLERYRGLRRAFAALDPLVCYALKANPGRAVCRLLASAGAGADVVSGGELWRALRAGFEARKIVFSGVGKTRDEMAAALRAGVLTLNVESAEELAALSSEAKRLRRRAPVCVRLNPDVDARTHAHIATGRAGDKFGVERGLALELYGRARRDPWLEVKGIQCHIGSQVVDTAPYRKALRAVLEVASVLTGWGVDLRLVDLGGGMGVPYADGRRLDLRRLAREVLRLLAPWPRARLILEPGRTLVADAGVLLTKVLYRKRGRRSRFVVVDAAMNDLLRPALYGARHPVVPAGAGRGPAARVDVVGPVCESADFLARGVVLPLPEPGDLLAVLKAGAYGFSMSSQYNSRPRAAEVLVRGASWAVIRRRETFADLVRGESARGER